MKYQYDIHQYRSPVRLIDPETNELLDQWETVTDFDLLFEDGRKVTIPSGFVYDKASVPRAVWWYLPRDDRRVAVAALVHDFLYVSQKIHGEWIKRSVADGIFYDLIRMAGMRWTKAKMAWIGVRSGGWVAFNPRAKKNGNVHYKQSAP